MKPVERAEIVDYQTYEDTRDETRAVVLDLKKPRRIHVGEHMTFLFENRDTVRYQIQEMVRVERLVRESDIQHEIDTYNELLGGPGELGCTLLIEIDDEAERQDKLRAWLNLPQHLYAQLPDGTRVPALFDARQVGEDRVSSVQYLKFDVGGQVPQSIGSALPALQVEAVLNDDQRKALAADLRP